MGMMWFTRDYAVDDGIGVCYLRSIIYRILMFGITGIGTTPKEYKTFITISICLTCSHSRTSITTRILRFLALPSRI